MILMKGAVLPRRRRDSGASSIAAVCLRSRRVVYVGPVFRPGTASQISVDTKVAADFPTRDVLDVIEPLLALGGHEMREGVFAERGAHEVILFELVKRFTEAGRQLPDPQVPPFAVAHLEDVLVDRRTRIDPLVDAVETGAKHHRKRKVRIA